MVLQGGDVIVAHCQLRPRVDLVPGEYGGGGGSGRMRGRESEGMDDRKFEE